MNSIFRTGTACAVVFATTILFLLTIPASAAPPRQDTDDLSQEMAVFRRAQVKSVAYDLHFALQENASTFEGRATLHVTLNEAGAPLSIDLKAPTLHEVTVDGKSIRNLVERNGSFDIPAEHLTTRPMEIVITYTGAYSETGEGLCHFTDPVDQKEYLYTNLEPYGAHTVFPCFDQPDIKATFALSVEAPSEWVVIGNCLITSRESIRDSRQVTLATSPPLSTYLVFLGAGAYQAWSDTHQGMPLTIYARTSLASYCDADRLLAETKAGLDYFNTYFSFPYPFDKYDHVFAPELGPGAMENPGAVTMNEHMLFRGAATAENYRDRNITLLHEMAHMWFGDLVTMAWWNDLWLNESFATFSSYQAQATMTRDPAVWQDFYGLKGWAYNQDQLSTTHPIETEVPSARMAMDNFDGITYAKGASALKQLWFQVGPEAYQRGVQAYFKAHAWKNATRAQFMQEIAVASGQNLDRWTERWLKTEGLARIEARFHCTDNAIDSFSLQHETVNAPALSPHRTQLALFNLDESGKLVPCDIVSATYEDSSTPVDALIGKPCPDFIYPNYEDMDYGLFFLDDRSYTTILEHMSALEDPFMRRMVWGTLYAMVRHEKLRASDFMALLLDNLPAESDTGMLEYLLGGRILSETYFYFLLPQTRANFAARAEATLWAGFQGAPDGSDARLLWQDAYVRLASRPEDREKLAALLDTGKLDQPRRWNVIGKLAQLGAPDAESRTQKELLRDGSDVGQRNAFSIRGAYPTPEAKHAQWDRLKNPSTSLSLLRVGSGSFHNPFHPELTDAFVEAWFDVVTTMDWEAEQHRIGIWFDNLIPPVYTPEFLARSREELAAMNLPPRARRAWQESNDQIERVIAIRAFDARTETPP